MDRPAPIPLRADPQALGEAARRSFIRACAASLMSANGGRMQLAETIARSRWPNDRDVALIAKAPSAPAVTGVPSWAGVLAHTGHVIDVISLLAPASVAAKVLQRCLGFEWPPGVVQMSIPAINVSGGIVAWTGEGVPIPVWDFISSAASLTPRKVSTICVFTREMLEHSTPNVENLLRAAIGESLGLALDSALFSAAAGDANTPTGILNGIAPLAASTQTIASEAMAEDASRIIASVAQVAGANEIVLVMSPRQAASMRVRTDIDFETFPSAALPDGTVAAIATNALASVGDSAPSFEGSIETTLHMQTVPAQIVDGSGTVAAPQKSLFQTDCLALRLRYSINWTLRSPAGVAWIQNVVW